MSVTGLVMLRNHIKTQRERENTQRTERGEAPLEHSPLWGDDIFHEAPAERGTPPVREKGAAR